jgi:CheY-like chemotaxis protein
MEVLAIEDEKTIASLIRKGLSGQGLVVEAVHHGEEGCADRGIDSPLDLPRPQPYAPIPMIRSAPPALPVPVAVPTGAAAGPCRA